MPHAVQQMALAPEQLEGMIEHLELFAPGQKYCSQRPVEIFAVLDAGKFERSQTINDPIGPHRHPGIAQRPGEVDDVLRQLHCQRLISDRMRAASLPRTEAMSS